MKKNKMVVSALASFLSLAGLVSGGAVANAAGVDSHHVATTVTAQRVLADGPVRLFNSELECEAYAAAQLFVGRVVVCQEYDAGTYGAFDNRA